MTRPRGVLVTALFVALVGGCGVFTAPAPTAEAMDDVIANLVLRGMTVHSLVSGDAGCANSDLHSNAVHMEVSLAGDASRHEIYLFRWRRPTDFGASAQAFSDCIRAYEAAHPGVAVTSVESEPWRAYGPSWPDALSRALRDGLRAAGGAE